MAQYKDLRKTAVVDRHEAQVSWAQSRREEQRTITVNRVRGDSVREAAQEVQSKELSEGPRNRGLETDASNDSPLRCHLKRRERIREPKIWGEALT